MESTYQPCPDVHVLPVTLPMGPGAFLTINAFLLMAEEPVLVDTGLGQDCDQLLDAVDEIVGLDNLKWVWLTHDDADHTGAIQQILTRTQATLATHALNAIRMNTWWQVPMNRVHAMRFGDTIHVGDRVLRAVPPPLYDNPTSTGFIDESTGNLFSVDSFGAVIPEPTQDAAEIPAEALAGGMLGWSMIDTPWASMLDREKFGAVLEGVRQLAPTRIFSSHLPAAMGTSLESFLAVLATAPDATPAVAMSHEEFTGMLAMMQAEMEAAVPEEVRLPVQGAAAPSPLPA